MSRRKYKPDRTGYTSTRERVVVLTLIGSVSSSQVEPVTEGEQAYQGVFFPNPGRERERKVFLFFMEHTVN